MKHDMGGSSAALGVFAAMEQTDFPYPGRDSWRQIMTYTVSF